MVNRLTMNGVRNHQGQAGVSLVEVLVAIVIFSFGTLGLLGLQTAVLRNQSQAGVRVAASLALSDIIEQMRANVAGADSYVSPAKSSSGACTAGTCTVAQLASSDMARWKAGLSSGIAAGVVTGTVAVDSVTGGYRATVSWTDVRIAADPQCSSSGADQARCCQAAPVTGVHCANAYFVL